MKKVILISVIVVVVVSSFALLKKYGWLATKTTTSDNWGSNCQLIVNGESKNGKYYHGVCRAI